MFNWIKLTEVRFGVDEYENSERTYWSVRGRFFTYEQLVSFLRKLPEFFSDAEIGDIDINFRYITSMDGSREIYEIWVQINLLSAGFLSYVDLDEKVRSMPL